MNKYCSHFLYLCLLSEKIKIFNSINSTLFKTQIMILIYVSMQILFRQLILLRIQGPAATVWYDWFLSETSPDPLVISQLEDMFHSAG